MDPRSPEDAAEGSREEDQHGISQEDQYEKRTPSDGLDEIEIIELDRISHGEGDGKRKQIQCHEVEMLHPAWSLR